MNLNLFDDMDGLILRERENSLYSPEVSGTAISPTQSKNQFPQNAPLAMAYVAFQEWGNVYNDDDAFPTGTLFPDLDFPFLRGAGNDE